MKPRLLATTFLIVLVLPLGITSPYFYHVVVIAGVYAMLALSLNLILGYVGQFPLGHNAFFGLGAYTAALVSVHTGANFVVSMACAIAFSGLVGLCIGLPTLKTKGPFFAIVSLSFNEIFFLIVWSWIGLAGGPDGIAGIPHPTLFGFALKSKVGLYYLMVTLLALMIVINMRIMSTKTGRTYLAVRENEELARSLGINPYLSKLQAFIISAMFGGMAGSFYAHFECFVSPTVFGFEYLTMMLVMVWVGGQGTIVGPIVGAVIFTFLQEYLHIFGIWRMVIFGLILLVSVIFMPKGLIGIAGKMIRPRLTPKGEPHAG